jgi:uncharacterized protein YndB with AHSA1/START domain
MITTEKNIISIKRTLDLPLDSVWKAWTEAESFKQWWGPSDYTCPHCKIDFKVGGHYLACMQSKNGDNVWSTGSFLEIEDHKKIVYTDSFADSKGNKVPASTYGIKGEWPLELIVTIELEEVNGKTDMLLTHEGISEAMHVDCISGWNQSLDKMERIFAES